MRRFLSLIAMSGLFLATACSKKVPAPPAASATPADAVTTPPSPTETKSEREKVFASLKAQRSENQNAAVLEAAALAEHDPAVVAALVDLLRDKGTAGPGRRLSDRTNSTREAAARALYESGDLGETALKAKGIAILREGLSDPSPAVREHTAYTLGVLEALAKPAARKLFELCTDPDAKVRGAAFDALDRIGVPDSLAMIQLLTHAEPDVRRLAAEAVLALPSIDPSATPLLIAALTNEDPAIRLAATNGLGKLSPQAAEAVPVLVEALRKFYPAMNDLEKPPPEGPETAYWEVLVRVGEPAVKPLSDLLGHTNAFVRGMAAQALGEIGPPAKPAADALKKQFQGREADVAFEAAAALCRIGVYESDAVDVIRKSFSAPVPEVAAFAILTVPRMGEAGRALIPDALAKLTSDKEVVRAAALELAAYLGPTDAQKAVPELATLTTDADPAVRGKVGEVLARLGPSAAGAAETVGKALAEEKETKVRETFVAALAAMGPGAKPAAAQLVAVAADPSADAELRLAALRAAAVAAPDSAAVATGLRAAAGDANEVIRAGAAAALGPIKPMPPATATTLANLMRKDKSFRVRQVAAKALALASPPAREVRTDLEAVANGPKDDLSFWARLALASFDGDSRKLTPVVRDGLKDKVGSVRAAALESLPLLGAAQPEDVPTLTKLLRDGSPTVRTGAAGALKRYGPAAKDAVPPLVRLLADKNVEARIAAVETLGSIGPAAAIAVPKLKPLAKDSEPALMKAANEALARIAPGSMTRGK